jgi:hypothetical protein
MENVIERAIRAYCRRTEGATQPSLTGSTKEGSTVILRNVNGVLARYRIRGDGRLAFIG